jgi:acetyl esterase/lipase
MRAAALLLLGACSGTMDSFFAQDVVDMHLDLAYVPGTDNPRQYLDLYAPRGVDPYPVVVFVHGGFWIHQDKDYFQPVVGLYRNVGIALARKGIGTAVIDYRLVAPPVTFEDQFDDVAQAIAWVHDHVRAYGGDPDRMVLAGHSAGGHITALAAFDSARIATPLLGYAPLSPILDLQAFTTSSSPDHDVPNQVFGADLAADSPSTYFSANVAPLLIVLGGNDEPGVLEQVPGDVAQLQALGAPLTFATIPGRSHDDIVLDFDTDHDSVTPLLAAFVGSL